MAYRLPQKGLPRDKDLRGLHRDAPGIGRYPYAEGGKVMFVTKRPLRKGYWLIFAVAASVAIGLTAGWVMSLIW